ncbi:hypothetical protein [Flavobacterium sp. XGLA_31]|uniref:hypothetical protein n=1 Tax=Flavobacterium sp. XGLA_31 TaxID=3447666 RepID=UPI003F3CDE7B
MKAKLVAIALFLYHLGFSQEIHNSDDINTKSSKYTYVKIDFSVPIRANQYAGEIDPYSGEKEPWFLPDGMSGRVGFGFKPNDWLGIGANVGMDWKGNECLVVTPVFGSVKISPKINQDLRVFVEPGLGRAFAIGSGQLSGYFKKISVGIGDGKDHFGLYLELCQYGFSKNFDEKIGSFSLGITFTL